MITTNGDYVLIETEDVEFKSAHGVVAPKGLEKSGNGIKGVVLADHFLHKKGDKVEFIRNMGYQIRQNVYAVKSENILLVGDLDEYLKK